MSEPTFSVAMPAYQSSATIGAAIRSVLGQTYSDFELHIVDDGSTDATADVVEPFLRDSRVRLIRHQRNIGLATARNSAIDAGRGRYVSMLDSDDVWLPNYLEVMQTLLAPRPDVGLVYTDAWVFDDVTRRFLRTSAMHFQDPPVPPPTDPLVFLAELLERNFIFTSATVRRSVLDRIGGYNTALSSAEDYELWLRIAVRGYPVLRTPGKLAIYRKRPGSISTQERLMLLGLVEAYNLVASDKRVPPALRERAAKLRIKAERSLAILDGERRPALVLELVRRSVQRLKQRIAIRLLQTSAIPPEVQQAFPDLRGI